MKQDGEPELVRVTLTQWFAHKKHGWGNDKEGRCFVVRKSDGCLPEIVNGVIFRRTASLKDDPKPADVILCEAVTTAEGNLRAKQWVRKRDYDKAEQKVKEAKEKAEKQKRQQTLQLRIAGIS